MKKAVFQCSRSSWQVMLTAKAVMSGVTMHTNRRKDEQADTHKQRHLSSHLKYTYKTQIAPFQTLINIPLHVDCITGCYSLPAFHSLTFLVLVCVTSKTVPWMDTQIIIDR
jgi:hypothetical protein